jgi:hypothetical protein
MRQCGSCTLCCKLMPVPPLGKKAGERCKFLKFHKNCTVYNRPQMPAECAIWNCRWLVDQAGDTRRPDHAHYVIDVMPDYITLQHNDTGQTQQIAVAQIWVDPSHPNAHRDPALRRWMVEQAEQGIAALIRYNSHETLTVFAPPFDVNGEWHEIKGGTAEQQHTLDDMMKALGGSARMVIEP